MYFDTHAHYDNPRFKADRHAVLTDLQQQGVSLVLNPGSDLASSERAVQLAQCYPFLYAAVGVHPHEARTMGETSIAALQEFAAQPKVVAIGEIGLDYHYDHSPRDIQRTRFREQMELAKQLGLPVIIHEREATADVMAVLRDFRGMPGVVHCFSGSVETARQLVDWGFHLSFTGVITYKNARHSHEALRAVPHDCVMIETDAPYLTPEPYRSKRNSSAYLVHIAAKIAELWGTTPEEVARITLENGTRLFRIRQVCQTPHAHLFGKFSES